MEEEEDIKFIRRCLDLAIKAEGSTTPNPMVGSVVVCDGRIIGEGYHLKAGGPHAEVIAINSVPDKSVLSHSTLYVNLEPCSHYGKTPPCADYIISNHIPRVVVGTADTSAKVSGQGISRLRDAGCEVITGVCEDECRRLNRRFFTFHEKNRPYITLKWARSADGYIDIDRPEGCISEPTWISGKPERVLVHRWRASEEAILVGAGTIRADNPRLNIREWKGRDPVKIVISRSGSIDHDSAINKTNGSLIVFTGNMDAVIAKGEKVQLDDNVSVSSQVAHYLYNMGVQSLLIEGGAQILNHFISEGLWDEARIFTGDVLFRRGVKSPVIKGKVISDIKFSESSLKVYANELI
jgi:diaminohydroxyphosphoribosylaminopyrimidine deaminase/5-amino-6-(5-phosphoribosylamino)uracil reductase